MQRAILAVLSLAGLSCGSPPSPPPLDVVLPVGQARAGKVTRPSELIGGPIAYGRVGDAWKLYNTKVRFLIQDVGTSVGLDLYGGNLIDADLVRPGDDGRNGNDLFRETFPIIGLHALNPRSIEVVADGTGGGPAILRVHGTDAPSDILPQLDDLALDLGGEITLEYRLDPDVPYLRITTTYRARPGQSLATLGLGDFLSFGAALAVLSPENGFTGKSTAVSFLAASGEGSSYGLVWPDGKLSIPLVDASGTATLFSSSPVPTDGTGSVTRYLVVGDGDAASVTGPMYALRKIATAPLTGRVLDDGGAPVGGARVTLFKAPYDAAADCVDQAKTNASGAYRFDVPPGSYVAIASGIGRLRGAATAVELPAAGAAVDVKVGAQGTVRLDIGERVDGKRIGAPAKVSFISETVETPDPRFGPDPTENERNGVRAVALTPDGKGTVLVKPGAYVVMTSRGVEYELVSASLVVAPAVETPFTADLHRVVDTSGWLSGDFHQHSQGSIDSPVPIAKRVVEDMAEGVEFPVGTDHDNVIDFRPHIAALDGGRWINSVPGNEISVNLVGHFNGYPIAVDPADPYAKVGAKFWARKTVRALATKVHAEPAPVAFHVSHPRSRSPAGWFNTVRFDPTTGKAAQDFPIESFEALEVNGDLGAPADYLAANDAAVHKAATQSVPSGLATMRDWFALLNLGRPITALGDSDTHQRNGGTGYPRSFVYFGTDDPSQATGDALVAAIKAQKVVVSHGPFVTTTLDGQAKLGLGAPVNLAGAPSATLGIKVQAPTWIDVASFEVYRNGRPLSLARTGPNAFAQRPDGEPGSSLQTAIDASDARDPVVRLDAAVAVTPTADCWYVVVVRGARSMLPVAGGRPYAYTNPIYVDVDGDGWTAPGLP